MTELKFHQQSPTAALRFGKRPLSGGYDALSETHCYTVARRGTDWVLTVQRLAETAGVKHTVGQPVLFEDVNPTKRLCVAVAQAYHALGDDYQQHEHGGRARRVEAVIRAYQRDSDRPLPPCAGCVNLGARS